MSGQYNEQDTALVARAEELGTILARIQDDLARHLRCYKNSTLPYRRQLKIHSEPLTVKREEALKELSGIMEQLEPKEAVRLRSSTTLPEE